MAGSRRPDLTTLLLAPRPVIAKEGRLRSGRPDGVWKGYGADGSLEVQGTYVRGVRHGRWIRWMSGSKVEVHYAKGRVEQVAVWYEDGSPALRARFENGDLAPGWEVFGLADRALRPIRQVRTAPEAEGVQ
jgi:antitoxin component YwqK of YwqJK toxin-antitoxin module